MNNINHLTRREFLRYAAGLGLSASGITLLNGCGIIPPMPIAKEPSLETTTVRLPQTPSLCITPTYVAEDFLKAEGFTDVKYINMSFAASLKSIGTGELDFGMQFSGPLITAVEAVAPLVILSGIHVGCFELFGTEQIRSITDLKGKSVAITELGGPEHIFISSMMAYVGVNPSKDINWVTIPVAEAKKQFADGKIDALLGFPPTPQELRSKNIGHVVVNSMMDKPWSQYFCCMFTSNREFVKKNPVATKRALRAFLKATDVCVHEPERVSRLLVDKGITQNYDYALQMMREFQESGAYGAWREYDPEDTLRFYGLRLNEVGMIKSNPNDLIARGTDWRFFHELKKEMKE